MDRATTSDYLIKTHFKIHKIADYSIYRHRFNNIIFNNFEAISALLTTSIFLPKSHQILSSQLANVRYVSLIYPNFKDGSYPLILQYFDPRKGVQHRILAFADSPTRLSAILWQHSLTEKLVGHCGDFGFADPGISTVSGHVTSLRLLSKRKVLHLPYSNGFLEFLFGNLLVDYLPFDVRDALVKLGETLKFIDCPKEMLVCYRQWSQKEEIIGSDFAQYVIENFRLIGRYLQPLRYLAHSVATLFADPFHKFLLIFIRDIYLKVNEVFRPHGIAVLYYSNLVQIEDLFQSWRDDCYIPQEAYNYLEEIKKKITEGEQLVDALDKEVTLIVSRTYSRATNCINELLKTFDNFESFTWLLLNEPVKLKAVHATYHFVKSGECDDDCALLQIEINRVNSLRSLHVGLDIVTRWLHIVDKVKVIGELVEFLFSLPCSYRVFDDLKGLGEVDEAEKIVRMNLGEMGEVEEFFGDFWTRAGQIVAENQVSALMD